MPQEDLRISNAGLRCDSCKGNSGKWITGRPTGTSRFLADLMEEKKYNIHESPVAVLKKPDTSYGLIAGEEPGYRTFCYRFPADRLRPDPPGEAVPSFFVPG